MICRSFDSNLDNASFKAICSSTLSFSSTLVSMFIKEKAGLCEPTYSKSIKLTDINNNFSNKIIYEYYNTKRIQKKV